MLYVNFNNTENRPLCSSQRTVPCVPPVFLQRTVPCVPNPFDQILADSDGLMYEYNSNGTISKITGESTDKTIVVYQYDDKGNVTSIVTSEFSVDETTEEAIINERTIEEITYQYTYYDGTNYIASETEVILTYTYNTETETETETETITSTYDSAGNLLSERTVHNDDDNTVTYTYNTNGTVATQIDCDGNIIIYTYDGYGYPIKAVNSLEGTITTDYNLVGWINTQTSTNGDRSSYVYDDFGTVLRETVNDKTTRYVYNTSGKLIQKIGAAEYISSYDGLNFETPIDTYSDKNSGIRYSYDENGKLSVMIFSDYTINYTESGEISSVTIGNHELLNYNYCDDVKELLEEINFANGQVVKYTYDENNNIIGISCGEEGLRFSFTYDENNEIGSITDILNNRKTLYVAEDVSTEATEENNISETLVETEESKQNTSDTKRVAMVYDTSSESPQLLYSYDVGSKNKNISIGSLSFTNNYSNKETTDCNDNVISTENISSIELAEHILYNTGVTDKDGKLTSSITNFNDFSIISKQFSYNTNNIISGEITTFASNSQELSYSYDNNNIIQISNGKINVTYFYDAANQLVRSNDGFNGKTYIYEYDNRGNILSKKEYTYTVEEDLSLLTPIKTDTFAYTNTAWADELTSFNGNIITYDDSGNIIAYNGYEYTWDMGRQLKKNI